jgi:hypothetical protein
MHGASSGAYNSSSRSPDIKRKPKKTAGLEKESKDQLKVIETKIDELRKQAFNEINRLETIIEKD